MAKDAIELQMICTSARNPNLWESLFAQEAGDWRQRYLDFLPNRLLSSNHSNVMKFKRKPFRFFVEEGLLS